MNKKTNWNIALYVVLGVIVLMLLLVFSGTFLVVDRVSTQAEADSIMQTYANQGYLCGYDGGKPIKYDDCSLYKWETGVYAGQYQIDCEDYDWVTSCTENQVPQTYVWCLVDDGVNGNCYSVFGNSCPTGEEYRTSYDCVAAKANIIPDRTPTTTTIKQTTTTSLVTTTTGAVTTTTLPPKDCTENPLDVSCYSCKDYQLVKDGVCKTTFRSILLYIQNWFVGLFSNA